jgi:hypothetical protein
LNSDQIRHFTLQAKRICGETENLYKILSLSLPILMPSSVHFGAILNNYYFKFTQNLTVDFIKIYQKRLLKFFKRMNCEIVDISQQTEILFFQDKISLILFGPLA